MQPITADYGIIRARDFNDHKLYVNCMGSGGDWEGDSVEGLDWGFAKSNKRDRARLKVGFGKSHILTDNNKLFPPSSLDLPGCAGLCNP